MKTDIIVIGAGSGGLTLAAGAAQMGANVVLVEKHKMGGDCLNYGCVPSKALLAASHQARVADGSFGVTGTKPEVDYAQVNKHIKSVIAGIEPHDSVERYTELGVQVIKGRAEFTGRNSIRVHKEDGSEQEISARYIVIATGSSPVVPPIPGLADCSYFTNETIFDNTRLPQHLMIIGGGPIGMEMAQAHRLLGSKVSVVDIGPILPRDDQALVKIARKQFEKDGIAFHELVKIDKMEAGKSDSDKVIMHLTTKDGKKETITASHLLVATGRGANIKDMGLENAGVEYHAKGIHVNERLQTSNKRIYAIGDVASPYQFTHVAGYHAGIVIRNILFKVRAKVDNDVIPWVTYTTPEMAHCGMLKHDAIARYGESKIRELDFPYEDNDRARAELATEGLIKVIVHKNGKILGVDIVGMNAGEIVQVWALAIKNKMKIGAVADYIAPYPTLGEISKRAAGKFYTDTLFNNNRLKALVRFLIRLPI